MSYKITLNAEDPDAQDLLWKYAIRKRTTNPAETKKVFEVLYKAGYQTPMEEKLNDTILELVKQLKKLPQVPRINQTFDELYFDSLDRLELVMLVEDYFCVDLFHEDHEGWVTIKDVVKSLMNDSSPILP